MVVRGSSLCPHSFWKLRDMPLPSPLITGCIQTTYYTHSTQNLYVQKAPGQAPGLVMQLKEGLEISRILVSILYTEINSRIMLIMRARHWMVSGLSPHFILSRFVCREWLYSQCNLSASHWAVVEDASYNTLARSGIGYIPAKPVPFLIVGECFCHRLTFHKESINTASPS